MTSEAVRLACNGDEAALECLIAKHFGALRDKIAPQIDPRWQALISAEDVVQQTAIDAPCRG
jgi:hypothetical protein